MSTSTQHDTPTSGTPRGSCARWADPPCRRCGPDAGLAVRLGPEPDRTRGCSRSSSPPPAAARSTDPLWLDHRLAPTSRIRTGSESVTGRQSRSGSARRDDGARFEPSGTWGIVTACDWQAVVRSHLARCSVADVVDSMVGVGPCRNAHRRPLPSKATGKTPATDRSLSKPFTSTGHPHRESPKPESTK